MIYISWRHCIGIIYTSVPFSTVVSRVSFTLCLLPIYTTSYHIAIVSMGYSLPLLLNLKRIYFTLAVFPIRGSFNPCGIFS